MMDRSSRWPHLARLAGRGSIEPLPPPRAADGLRPWQAALLISLDLSASHDHYPSAAVTRTGDIGERAGGYWLHALPMHFAAGLNHLTAVLLQGEGRVAKAERAELEPTVAAHLRSSGFELLSTAGGEWLVRSDRALEVQTLSPEAAASNPLDEVMPRGRDAAELRRLMTELQMLLHEHPVGAQRLKRGVSEINAIWFYGQGSIGGVRRQPLPQAFGDDAYLRGVYRLHDHIVEPVPTDAKALLARMTASAVAVVAVEDLDTLEALWIAPLARALAMGLLGHVDLVLDRWRLAIPRRALFKFWRQQRSPAQWAA
jgi:hypothetical protein